MRERFRFAPLGALVTFAVAPLLVAGVAPRDGESRATARTVWDSVYSAAQAARGDSAYAKSCARCHGATLAGADQSPPLSGGAFLGNWNGLALSELHARIKTTMPSDSVGILDGRVVTDVIAYLLKSNGFPEGMRDLPAEADSLKAILLQTSRP